MGRPLKKNEIPINPRLTFEISAIYFVGPFPRLGYRKGARYIIIVVEYVTKWEEADTKFIYENIITRFGFLITHISDRGTHFINQTIETIMKENMIDHHEISSYHLQHIGSIESCNKTLAKGLTKTYNIDKDDWDDKIPTILWAYTKNFKISTGQTPFRMVYGQKVVFPLEFK